MKNRTLKWSGDTPVPNWKRNILEINSRTYTPRIIRPTRTCKFSNTGIESELDILGMPDYIVSAKPFGHILFKVTRRITVISL